MKTNSTALMISLFFYQRLLRLYPITFRERFGTELIQTYIGLINQTQDNNRNFSLFGLWSWLLPDLFASILKERFQEWRNEMKSSWSIAKVFGIFSLMLWFSFWGLSLGRNVFHLPIKDPTYWVLGDQFSGLAFNAFNFCILFVPFLVLMIFLAQSIKIIRISGPDNILQIQLMRISRLSLLVMSICGIVTALYWSAIILSRLGF